jgi:hypothetical protein
VRDRVVEAPVRRSSRQPHLYALLAAGPLGVIGGDDVVTGRPA